MRNYIRPTLFNRISFRLFLPRLFVIFSCPMARYLGHFLFPHANEKVKLPVITHEWETGMTSRAR